MTTKQAVVFAILMENQSGIVYKSPDYIREKLDACSDAIDATYLLDESNMDKFREWEQTWNQG